MSTFAAPASKRLDIVDALRGFAMMGICLLHFVEHFDMGGRPSFVPDWLKYWDTWSNDFIFFAFAGKSYSLFALLFGVSFFILMDNAARRGEDFRLRFLWRLLLLYSIGYVHSLLFVGDFLTNIAVLGVFVVVFWRLPGKVLWPLAVALLLMIPNLIPVVRALIEPGYVAGPFSPGRYYRDVMPAFRPGPLSEVLRVNLWLGHKAKWNWTFENGRYLQMLGLFALGLMLGRSRLFEKTELLKKAAWGIFVCALILLIPLYILKARMGDYFADKNMLRMAVSYLSMHLNLIQMLGGSAFLVLLFQTKAGRAAIGLLVPYGRMSLSCYVTQAVIGVPLFYSFGLGMYRHMGPFYSVLAGVLFFVCHLWLAHLWLRHFHQGPFEWLWRCATEMDFSRPFRKRPSSRALSENENQASIGRIEPSVS